MEIKDYREEINKLDKQIVSLLEKRMDVASAIGLEKKKLGLPVFDGAREKERIETVKALASNPIYKDHIGEIYQKLMDETKLVEQQLIDGDC